MRILGIDPGLATMGWGVIEADGYREKLVQYGALITYPRDTFPHAPGAASTGVRGLLETFKPDEIAFEELFFSKNVTTGIQVGGARGAALVACQEYTDNLFEYTPMQIKQAVVGYGGADKHQVQMMVRMLLGIREIPKPDDAADAVAWPSPTRTRARGASISELSEAIMIDFIEGTVESKAPGDWSSARAASVFAALLQRDAGGKPREGRKMALLFRAERARTPWSCSASPPGRSARCSKSSVR